MPSQIYEILSLMMRYWFAALGVLIVLRAFWWLWKDHRSREKKRRSLPDAGSIGEFVVESDCAALPQDTLLPVPADGTLGSVRSCDIVVPARGVSPRHLDVMFRNGYGLYIIPWRGCSCIVDGETVANRRDGMAHPLQHNSILEVGQARLRLRVFAGLDVEDVRAYAERREDEDGIGCYCAYFVFGQLAWSITGFNHHSGILAYRFYPDASYGYSCQSSVTRSHRFWNHCRWCHCYAGNYSQET